LYRGRVTIGRFGRTSSGPCTGQRFPEFDWYVEVPMKRTLMLILASAVAVAICSPAFAADAAKMKTGKSRYLVIAPHTAEQCMAAMENIDKADAKALAKWDFGCKDNDHTGYLIVMAASADEALKNVPESDRGTAKAVKLSKFTAAELKAAHASMESMQKPAESTDKK